MDKEQFDDLCFKQFTEAQEEATKQIPDGIIRAYRKAKRAMAECDTLNINARPAYLLDLWRIVGTHPTLSRLD